MRVIFAGGGTGGHLYPAMAMAAEVMERDPHGAVLFVGTREGIESRILAQEGWPLREIRVVGVKGKRVRERIRAAALLPGALFQSFSILGSFRPDVVIGVGGYASGPVVLAAVLTGRTAVLQEQNSVPGLTNRLLGRVARRVYTAYPESAAFFPPGKVLETGNPIRRGLGGGDRGEAVRHFGLDPERHTVLVLGGSRGAHAVNRMISEMIREEGWADLSLQFLHQTGEADLTEVRRAYDSAGIAAEVRPYLREMDRAYAAADLVVARAGAVTLSELWAAGLPALLIPFPYAADDHQMRNAAVAAAAGAAEVLVQKTTTSRVLGERVRSLLEDPRRLHRMREAAGALARPHAAREVMDDVARLVGQAAANKER